MYQQPRREPEIDLDQILKRLTDALSGGSKRFGGNILNVLVMGVLLIALIGWLATGVYTVGPGEQAAIRTFGKCCDIQGEGLHWWWPAPIGTRNVESIQEIRSMDLGFSSSGNVSSNVLLDEAQMIAGDLNIVDVPLVIQYRISDLSSFLFKVADPGESIPFGTRDVLPDRPEGRTLKDATEAALRLVVGQRTIDDVLTDNKPEVQEETRVLLQSILDSYQAGIEVTAVLLQEVKAPEEVRDAFQDVNRARQDKETLINNAEAFERDIIPRARGEAEQILKAAEGFKRERIAKAEGEASRFLSVLNEYRNSSEVTRQRLYLEAVEEILPNVRKFIVSPQAGGNVLPFLPLDEMFATSLDQGGATLDMPGESP